MKIRVGDMWSEYNSAKLFCITTNSTLNSNGELVMGRGIAKQARDRYPNLAANAGWKLLEMGKVGQFYGLLVNANFPKSPMALFQVKYHWNRAAELELISRSAEMLVWFIAQNNIDPTKVHLNTPGIGNGRLPIESVMAIMQEKFSLMDINLWRYK